ncbi:MAG TPA: hypothetical protein VMV83_10750 [Rectinemataceae bacterium]|nr:hypothetical protein [Rectinemataceae bacterium]
MKVSISRWFILTGLAFLLLCSPHPPELAAQEDSQQGLADLVIDGAKVGAIQFEIKPGGELSLSTFDLKPFLGPLLRPSITASLFDKDRAIRVSELGLFGIRVSLDAANLVLSINLDPQSMRPEVIAARERPEAGKGEIRYKNADFAGTVATSLEFDPSWQTGGSTSQASWTSVLRLMPAIDLFGYVAEASASLSLSPYGASTALDAARAVKDFPRIGSRLQAGIIAAPVVSFQSGRQLYGIAFGREEGLPGWTNSPDVTSGEFVLQADATVRVFVNGSFTRQLSLAAGTYHLSDLPLSSGLNEVRIDIAEKGEAPRTIKLGIPYDQGVIGAGKVDYAIGLGVSQDDPTQPFGSAHVAMGLADRYQIGADLEAGYATGLGGITSIAATSAGSFGLAGALSFGLLDKVASQAPAFAGRAFWRFSSFFDQRIPRLGLAAEYQGPGFAVPGSTMSRAADYWDFSGQSGFALPRRTGIFALSGDIAYLAGALASWSFTAGPALSIAPSTLLSMSGGYDWKPDTGGQPRLSMTLTVAPPDRRGINYQRDFIGQSDSVNFGFPLGDNGLLTITGQNLVGTNANREVDASGSVNLPLATLSASGSLGNDAAAGFNGGQLSLSAASALAFADGHFAVTRTPGSALAILVPAKSLGGQLIEVRPKGAAPTLVPMGRPAAIANLTPYSPFVANIEMPESPPDVLPDPTSVELMPAYRSITIVTIKQASSASVRGTLVDSKGKPKTNIAGDLFDESGKAIAGGATFTDETGVFECFGLPRGRLTIKWDDGSESTIEVPEGEAGAVVELGTVAAIRTAAGEGGK